MRLARQHELTHAHETATALAAVLATALAAALAAALAGSGGRGAHLEEVEPVCAGQPLAARQEAGPRVVGGAGGWPLTEHG